ncbi:IS66 family transposase [Vibrio harveyi]|nr:IS66 family transposase [Vibrio harveyi]MCG9669793.1 IS66 family transposase [Vibrio harveyi]
MKFQYGLPLTRIASLFGDWGIDISRRTLADWGIQGAEILESVWTHLRSRFCRKVWFCRLIFAHFRLDTLNYNV